MGVVLLDADDVDVGRRIRRRRRGVGCGGGQGGDDAGLEGADNDEADNENAGC